MYWNTKRNHTKCWTLFLAIFFSTQVSQLVRVKRSFLTKYRKGDCTIRVPLSDWKQIVSSLLSLDSWCFTTEHDPLSSNLFNKSRQDEEIVLGRTVFNVCLIETKNGVLGVDYQMMNTFESVWYSKNDVPICSMSN